MNHPTHRLVRNGLVFNSFALMSKKVTFSNLGIPYPYPLPKLNFRASCNSSRFRRAYFSRFRGQNTARRLLHFVLRELIYLLNLSRSSGLYFIIHKSIMACRRASCTLFITLSQFLPVVRVCSSELCNSLLCPSRGLF